MTARSWLRHAGGRGGPALRGAAARKGEQRLVGPEEERDGAPPPREEYPGPQTSSDGEHVEPGQIREARPSMTATREKSNGYSTSRKR